MLPEAETLATIVVCEDDEPTLELLCDHLRADRYEPLPAPEASDALRHCRYKHPDLLLLDLLLPDAAGLDVLREIRRAHGALAEFDPDLPIIVLTGRGAEADRVRGFAEGADDYVLKPFHYPELVARIRAVLRRRSAEREGPRRVGELTVDAATRDVRVGDRAVELANKEFQSQPVFLGFSRSCTALRLRNASASAISSTTTPSSCAALMAACVRRRARSRAFWASNSSFRAAESRRR